MKKSLFFIVAMVVATFVSCEKSNETEPSKVVEKDGTVRFYASSQLCNTNDFTLEFLQSVDGADYSKISALIVESDKEEDREILFALGVAGLPVTQLKVFAANVKLPEGKECKFKMNIVRTNLPLADTTYTIVYGTKVFCGYQSKIGTTGIDVDVQRAALTQAYIDTHFNINEVKITVQ